MIFVFCFWIVGKSLYSQAEQQILSNETFKLNISHYNWLIHYLELDLDEVEAADINSVVTYELPDGTAAQTTVALLEAGSLFNDLRYLNAVMKSNDRLYNAISKIKFPYSASKKSINIISIALHYNYVINLQEKFYRSLIWTI